jgi:hypothetical protein
MAVSAINVLTVGITATAALEQFRAVSHTGGYPSDGGNALGFTTLAVANGGRASVAVLGTAIATAGAAITAGALLEVDGTVGKVITHAGGGNKEVGRALTSAAADGDQIEVLILPN